MWALSSYFVSSSIPSWKVLTAHAQPFREARDLAFCLKVPLDSLLVWASSGGSGETARMRRLAWTFAARIGDKYQIRLTRSIWYWDRSWKPWHTFLTPSTRPRNLPECPVCREHLSFIYGFILLAWSLVLYSILYYQTVNRKKLLCNMNVSMQLLTTKVFYFEWWSCCSRSWFYY